MNYLQQYRLRVKTLSPVFIGSGASLTKKEYLFVPQSKEIRFVNQQQLFHLLESKKLTSAYEDFILGKQKDLYIWMTSQNLKQEEICSVQSYSIYAGDAMDTSSGFNLTGIQLFMKDAWNHPYIPGSSLKGAIRTAILAELTSKRNYATRLWDYKKKLNNNSPEIFKCESKKVEAECLHLLKYHDNRGHEISASNAVNSVMKGIQITDGKPLSSDCLTLCSKVDISTKGEPKSINTARECIRPGFISEHLLTLDTQILAEANLNVPAIQNAIHRAYEIQDQYFLSRFPKIQGMDTTPSNGFELFLGGGAGFASKTILYSMLKGDSLSLTAGLMKHQFPQHYHDQDVERGVSPHMLKCTRYDGKFYLMGRCEIEIL